MTFNRKNEITTTVKFLFESNSCSRFGLFVELFIQKTIRVGTLHSIYIKMGFNKKHNFRGIYLYGSHCASRQTVHNFADVTIDQSK